MELIYTYKLSTEDVLYSIRNYNHYFVITSKKYNLQRY